MEEAITASQNIESSRHGSIQAQSAEVTDAMRLAVHEALTKGAGSCADDAIAIAGDDRLMVGVGMARFDEEIRLALQRQTDSPGHWIFPEQAADAGIVGCGGPGKLDFRVYARPHFIPLPRGKGDKSGGRSVGVL